MNLLRFENRKCMSCFAILITYKSEDGSLGRFGDRFYFHLCAFVKLSLP